MKKKKLINSLLGIGLGLSLLCGCGTSNTPSAATSQAPAGDNSNTEAAATEATNSQPTEAPAETATEAPAETATEAPAETATEAPAETATEAPAETAETQLSEDAKNAIRAYAEVLAGTRDVDMEEPMSFEYSHYALIHLDSDDIPELVLIIENSHPIGPWFFSFDGSEVKKIYACGSMGAGLYEKNSGIAFGYYTGMGCSLTRVGVIENGVLKEDIYAEAIDLSAAVPSQSGFQYYNGMGDELSKEQYDQLLSDYLPEKHTYSLLDYEQLPSAEDAVDPEQALYDSLAAEDELPIVEKEWYYDNIVHEN